MKKRATSKALAPKPAPPVDPERLRKEFPEVSAVEMHAYLTVTQDIMTAANRAAVLREVLERGRSAQDLNQRGEALDEAHALASNYLAAIGKMQRSTAARTTH
jgi:hypothetical protein